MMQCVAAISPRPARSEEGALDDDPQKTWQIKRSKYHLFSTEVTSSQPPAETDDGDVEEVELEGDGDPSAAAVAMIQSGITIGDISLTSQALQNPQVLAALQDRLGNIMGQSSGYVENLPKVVKRRIKALKNLQVQCTKIEAKFYEEVHQLECKYAKQYQPLFERVSTVV
ncbi:NAP1L1 [Branchiostoma lanceolatum]|uniref:NAP1L1 protein n=1 Tax=Branchiostoma lanceolatum TaxID=7740 RepID=A0A8K0EPR3_BRALA|nr:NAP1L1 [Branchiostoma lanceolatum]